MLSSTSFRGCVPSPKPIHDTYGLKGLKLWLSSFFKRDRRKTHTHIGKKETLTDTWVWVARLHHQSSPQTCFSRMSWRSDSPSMRLGAFPFNINALERPRRCSQSKFWNFCPQCGRKSPNPGEQNKPPCRVVPELHCPRYGWDPILLSDRPISNDQTSRSS